MLRMVVTAMAAILSCIGVGLLACGVRAPGWQALILGGIVLVGTLFERWRYSRVGAAPQGDWQRTGERFIDPSSGQEVEVMFDSRSGERRYVAANSSETKSRIP
jgi:hypothetical protein